MADVPQVDEYSGMSIVDIAHAVVNWPEGSEDQQRAIAAIQARAPGIGHNRPPLGEELVGEVAPLASRQAVMIETAGQAVIVDDDSAGKVTDLSVQVKALEEEIKQARDAKLRPINEQYNPLIAALAAAYGNKMTGLRGMLNAYVQKREAAAAAERARLAAEQRQREEEAAAARRKAEEAQAAGKGTVAAELGALKAEDAADRAQQRTEAVRTAPIRSQLGQVNTTRSIAHDFDGETEGEQLAAARKALGWALKQPGMRAVIVADLRKMCGAYLRQLGVDAVERAQTTATELIPGVKAWIERSAGVRR